MKTVATAWISIAIAACVATNADDGSMTSTTEQAVTRTCSPLIDTGKGGYYACYVSDTGGPYVVTGVTQTECTACGVAVSTALCAQYNYPSELTYCQGIDTGGGGGGGGGGRSGNPCGTGCFQEASGWCSCLPGF